MRQYYITLSIILLFVAFARPLPAAPAASEAEADNPGAPYFYVNAENPDMETLPLKSTKVAAQIAGVIADVTVRQEYQNLGKKPIEAVYIFPGSTRSAVYGMTMRIGERTIEADIDERQAARASYEAARRQGQSASLLEQQRPNVFQMNVANILPGDTILVELRYTELLVPEDGVYAFVYPTVVGPRYAGPQGNPARAPETWTENPYLHQGEAPKSTLNIAVRINAGLPIARVSCDTHKTDIRFDGKTSADITLDQTEPFSGNRDFILQYQLSGSRIETGALLLEGEKENFFLVMMQPPAQVKADAIPPREYIFIVDVSGSMHGFPLDISKALLKNLISGLRPADRFNVLLFAGSASVLADQSLPATPENLARAIGVIDAQQGGGGTELLPAMRMAFDLPAAEGVSRTLVIATDGFVSVETETFELIRKRLGDANLFAFGIGSSVNRYLIEGMARAGMGEPFIVTRPEAAASQAEKLKTLIETPALTDIRVDYGKLKVYDVEPVAVPDVFARRPVIVFGKYRGKPAGKIQVTGLTGKKPYQWRADLGDVKPDPRNKALRHLWARHRIAALSDDNALSPSDVRIKEVTRLGLEYHLLTAYTSFVAVDSLKRTQGGEPTVVKQPLPLPEGVSELAVGGARSFAGSQHLTDGLEAPLYFHKSMPTPGAAPVMIQEATGKNEMTADREMKKPSVDKKEKTIQLTLKAVRGAKGISHEALMTLFKNQAPLVEACLVDHPEAWKGLKKGLTITLELDALGRVKTVNFDKTKGTLPETWKKCLTNLFTSLALPQATEGKGYDVEIEYGVETGE